LLPLVLRDVVRRYTERVTRQRVEEQLRHTTKMEAIGRLASGIAHDFNNLLTGILGHANLLKLHAKPDSPVREAAEAIETAAQRAGELTEKLLGFARKGKHEVVPVDVHGLIHDAVALLSRLLGENVRITLDLHAPEAAALGDPTQLHQVFLNLAVNARDAMPGGGELTLGSGITTVEESTAAPPELEAGRYLRIEVADTGSGMSPDVQERVFEPFFTTKDADGSVGLGLPMVYGIIKNHGGAIEVESEEGTGTTFTIYLPLAEAAEAAPAEAEPPTVTRGSGRLLLVDDEQVIRHVGAHMLENLGYEPVVLSSAQEAIDYYRQHGAEVDLVIIDVSMPDMNGYQCFRALREIDPAVRAILSSGYTQDAKVQDAMADGICGFVQKPYRVGDLSEAIQRAMGYT
jgi:nitrogen-specific signal transduction histidine kinase/CheY-like chemotaxis protein